MQHVTISRIVFALIEWALRRPGAFPSACFYRQRERSGDRTPYLFRYYLLGKPDSRWFGVYLHHFVASDDEGYHDHPWPFVSILLQGGYAEDRPGDGVRRRSRRGSMIVRLPRAFHRIHDPEPGTFTLVIRGPRVRRWGFFPPGAKWEEGTSVAAPPEVR